MLRHMACVLPKHKRYCHRCGTILLLVEACGFCGALSPFTDGRGKHVHIGGVRVSKRLVKVHTRDKEICHLCGRLVPLASASLDHLITRADGGTDALENVALAHKGCNQLRGRRSVEEGRRHVRAALGMV